MKKTYILNEFEQKAISVKFPLLNIQFYDYISETEIHCFKKSDDKLFCIVSTVTWSDNNQIAKSLQQIISDIKSYEKERL